jgi:hypothetical protein
VEPEVRVPVRVPTADEHDAAEADGDKPFEVACRVANRFRPIEIVQTGLVDQLPIFGGGGGVTARIPSAGPVRVTVSGQGLGPDPRVYDINVKDYLVVSIGDSYSSGQGNPDRNGIPAVGSEAICEATTLVMLVQKLHDALEEIPAIGEAVEFFEDIFEGLVDIGEGILGFFTGEDEWVHMDPPPVWLEPLAWRSLRSSPALAAQAARNRFGRLITFVSVAQSGAEIDSGLLRPQRDFVNVGQIDEVVELLRDPRDRTRLLRPVDVLIMSIGGNDVGFSGTLSDMTTEKVIIGMLWKIGGDATGGPRPGRGQASRPTREIRPAERRDPTQARPEGDPHPRVPDRALRRQERTTDRRMRHLRRHRLAGRFCERRRVDRRAG